MSSNVLLNLVVVGLLAWLAPLPAAAQSPATTNVVTETDRKIMPNDLLVITIVGEAGLQTDFRVSASSTIQFPYLDTLETKGLTPDELREKIRTQLIQKEYFVDPQLVVTVKEYRQDYVRVIGQVNRPGPVQLFNDKRMDILDVISFAGGTTRLAKNKVEYTHNGQTRVFSLEELKKQTDPQRKIWVEPGDIVEVRESAL
jgi:polysaccharide export outer membrane protein